MRLCQRRRARINWPTVIGNVSAPSDNDYANWQRVSAQERETERENVANGNGNKNVRTEQPVVPCSRCLCCILSPVDKWTQHTPLRVPCGVVHMSVDAKMQLDPEWSEVNEWAVYYWVLKPPVRII